jgi:hypothetical protein
VNYVDGSKLVKIVGAIGFVAAGFLTYGDGVLFEQIYIALLVFMAVVFIRDINIVSIIFISAAANLSSKFLYPVFLESDYQTLLKILVYGAIALTLLRFKTEAHRKSVAGFVGLCVAAEIYWIATDYNAPYIYWNVLLININILVRYFLFQRVFSLVFHALAYGNINRISGKAYFGCANHDYLLRITLYFSRANDLFSAAYPLSRIQSHSLRMV